MLSSISSTPSLPRKELPRDERDALCVLNAVSGLGNRRILKLVEHFGQASRVLAAPVRELVGLGLPEAAALNLRHFAADEFLDREHKALSEQRARLLTILDPDYPENLREISDAPVVLYVAGELPAPKAVGVAIVGSRRPTLYGLEIAGRLAIALSEAGAVVISGLARGIDAAAHRGALKAGGRTLAVLGCGLDVVYPRENEGLYRSLRKLGCLVSEFPFGTQPVPYNFPRRNRIVSGLSEGVVVVEANVKSGALVTAGFALEQGREVFAVPGRIDSKLSEGPHALIRQGAKIVGSLEDILEELRVEARGVKESGAPATASEKLPEGLDGDEKLILGLIRDGAAGLEELEARTGRSTSVLMGPLLTLQIKRLIKELPGKMYEAC